MFTAGCNTTNTFQERLSESVHHIRTITRLPYLYDNNYKHINTFDSNMANGYPLTIELEPSGD